jgi:hypothetical protein
MIINPSAFQFRNEVKKNLGIFSFHLLVPIYYEVRETVNDRLCGLVVRVPGSRSRGPGSIPDTARFFLRSSRSGTGSAQPREDNCSSRSYFKEIAAPV